MPGSERRSSRLDAHSQKEWIDACHWIREHTAPGDLIQATNENWAVKWYTERPEYVNYKDCPQDAASLVEWNRRLGVINDWNRDSFADLEIKVSELKRLRETTKIRYLLCGRFGPLPLEPVYQNSTYKVFDLASLDAAK